MSDYFVLDASASISLVLNNEGSKKLASSYLNYSGSIVPDLYFYEITNVVWKYQRFDNWTESHALKTQQELLELPDRMISMRKKKQEILQLAIKLEHSIYDVTYLQLALWQQVPLMTLDKKLKRLAEELGIKVLTI